MSVRVLVVDDSVVVRRVVARALAAEEGIEVCGTASNGRLGLDRIRQESPDVVVLDLEMPEMDGHQVLAELRGSVPVIVFSALSRRGAVATLDALALGARDYVLKPSGLGHAAEAAGIIGCELAPRVRALAARTAGPPPTVTATPRDTPPTRPAVVAIVASTGGPEALGTLLAALPATLPVPLLVVQHMPPPFTRLLAERLDRRCALRVVEAADGEAPAAGTVYFAPGGQHLTVDAERTLRLSDEAPEHASRPAADPLLRSLAAAYGAETLGIVLTGMGRDALAGCRAIRAAGGAILAQDRASSVVWGMAGLVAAEGLADAILPPAGLADALRQRVSA